MNSRYMRERCTNTEFYKIMFEIREEKECSIRGLAKECGLCYGTLIEFFNVDKLSYDWVKNFIWISYIIFLHKFSN